MELLFCGLFMNKEVLSAIIENWAKYKNFSAVTIKEETNVQA
jgi:hypothetical protein